MITNTAQTSTTTSRFRAPRLDPRRNLPRPGATARSGIGCPRATAIALGVFFASVSLTWASTVLGPWIPLFKGVEHAAGTNTPGGGGFPDLQVVHCLRVDLTDPDVQLYASPRVTNYLAGSRETGGYTTTNFLKNHNLQVAINANQFFLPGSSDYPSYTLPEGTVFNASQLLISQGDVVSSQDSPDDPAVLMFATNNTPTFVPTNWPARSTSGIYTAVAGTYSILVNGVNIGSNYITTTWGIHNIQPRTAFGLSQDRHYLFLLTIDGRQPGYSVGAYDWETAAWLLLVGAWDGINLDGGGSTCVVVMDSTTHPVVLNRDTASAQFNRERTVGAHLGIYAQPVPGFFNNVLALPNDTAATITWTTISPATTQLKYGLTTNFDFTTPLNAAFVTNHAVLLTNLSPDAGYYFALLGTTGTNQYTSPNLFFVTTNYVTTNTLFDFTNTWKYTTANLDGVAWTAGGYNDSSWTGSGPGLLWVDADGANANIPVTLSTLMPEDPSNPGYPFLTYYFRTHFTFTNSVSGVAMKLKGYVDDGAVFYLNGAEICRLRMPAAPTPIYNGTIALTYPCDGDATCLDTLSVSGPLITTNLVVGDNVLAVEVHNYDPYSPDVTFGLSAACTVPYVSGPRLNVAVSPNLVTLSWSQGGFTLQQANACTGAWSTVPGPVVSSPFTTNNSGAARFYRLQK